MIKQLITLEKRIENGTHTHGIQREIEHVKKSLLEPLKALQLDELNTKFS